MRRLYNSLILLASAAIFHASPLLAEAPQRGTAPASVHAWVNAANGRIDEAMSNPTGLNGTVTALFRRGEDGRATDVQIIGATPEMERAARITLLRVRHLPPLPRGVDRNQRIKLQLLLDSGADAKVFNQKRQDMLAAAEVANGRFAGSRAIMAQNR